VCVSGALCMRVCMSLSATVRVHASTGACVTLVRGSKAGGAAQGMGTPSGGLGQGGSEEGVVGGNLGECGAGQR